MNKKVLLIGILLTLMASYVPYSVLQEDLKLLKSLHSLEAKEKVLQQQLRYFAGLGAEKRPSPTVNESAVSLVREAPLHGCLVSISFKKKLDGNLAFYDGKASCSVAGFRGMQKLVKSFFMKYPVLINNFILKGNKFSASFRVYGREEKWRP